MEFSLPKIGKNALDFPHFPAKHQVFIFRAWEYVPAEKIASILATTAENVRKAAYDMGLPQKEGEEVWLEKGYITIIRNLWHILPYNQLLELLDMDEQTLARILREEDFLDIKLGDKPYCEHVHWRELTVEEKQKTSAIKTIMENIDLEGVDAFDFRYETPKLSFSGEEVFETRMIYAFSGLYQHAFDVDSRIFCPDDMLAAYRDLGINGIWTQAVLSQLTEFPFAPEISTGHKERLKRLKDFSDRLNSFGLKLYLYINEPRSMPLAFFEEYPHLKGHTMGDDASLCTSAPEVRAYLKNAIESICREVPDIGGFFTITRSENLTNCYSHSGSEGIECTCPRCKDKSVGEVIGATISCISEAAHKVNENIKVFAWSWGWNEHSEDIIRHLPKDVILMSQSELHIPTDIGGVKSKVIDYSMSIIGPGENAKREWALARELGLETAAKVQINTTWEASTVPSLPVFPSIEKHMEGLKAEKVKHLLLSWTLGGYPGINIAHAAKYFYENVSAEGENELLRLAADKFSEAFKEFPFHYKSLYFGPQNGGPSNLLFDKSTGYTATMTCFAYDDLEHWRSVYPVDVYETQFEKLCDGWKVGLKILKDAPEFEAKIMAEAAYCLFTSSLHQIKFVRAREEGRYADCIALAEKEIDTARKMLELMNKNAAIGFEAANHYYFSKGQLAEKIVSCQYLIDLYNRQLSE